MNFFVLTLPLQSFIFMIYTPEGSPLVLTYCDFIDDETTRPSDDIT